ncbi:MAG: class I lanthipeptide [Acidobacteria bacterium]|nr:class I lanthipeptide [Acidobacteriota bacterium]
MRKNRKRLVLNKETVAVLSDPKLLGVHGGGPTPGYGECLTDRCSVAYCFTTGPTCQPDNRDSS